MTDPTGRSFLSYSSEDAEAARRLIEAQHEIGIPTWRDVDDLPIGPIPENLRKEIRSSASAIAWITETSLRSDWFRLEMKEIARVREDDGFFFLPVAAGLSRQDAAAGLRGRFGVLDPSAHTIEECPKEVPTPALAQSFARRVLDQRIRSLHAHLPAGEPLRIQLRTWQAGGNADGSALVLDWRHHFGTPEARLANKKESWSRVLLPALRTVRDTLGNRAAGRRIEAGGNASLTALMAFGITFLAVTGFHVSWRQETPGQASLLFSLHEPPAPLVLPVRLTEGNPAATDLAVLLSVAREVGPGFAESRCALPGFRGILELGWGAPQHMRITEAGQATAIARQAIEAVQDAVARLRPLTIHWFVAVPAGLAMLLGQLLNALPPSQMYEHLEDQGYVPSASLRSRR